jgi:hypothetical protein
MLQIGQTGIMQGGDTADIPASRVIPLGIGFWVLGVLSVRVMVPLGLFHAGLALPLLVATLPVTWLAIRLGRRLLGLPADKLVYGMALLSVPALLLDGTVLSVAPTVYCADPLEQRAAAAWLLWFVGATLATAYVIAARGRDKSAGV